MQALVFSILGLVGGVADVLPSNTAENMFLFIVALAGTYVFAAIQGVICGVFTNGDPAEIAWRQDMDALNSMMRDHKLEQARRRSVPVE